MAKHIGEGEFEEGTRRYEKRVGMLPGSSDATTAAIAKQKARLKLLNTGTNVAPATVDQSTDFSVTPIGSKEPAADVKDRIEIMKDNETEY